MSSETIRAVFWTSRVLRVTAPLVLLGTLTQGLVVPAAQARAWLAERAPAAALATAAATGASAPVGLFVTGDVGLLAVHSAVGSTIPLVALVQFLAALLDRRVRRRPGEAATWRLPVLSGFFLALVITQLGLGMARAVAPHMFIGVTSAALAMLMTLVVLAETGPVPATQPVVTVGREEGR